MSSQNVCASTLISIYRCKWHETVNRNVLCMEVGEFPYN